MLRDVNDRPSAIAGLIAITAIAVVILLVLAIGAALWMRDMHFMDN